MEFQNAGIDIDSLPKTEDIQLQPVDPRYLQVLWRHWLVGWFVVLVIASLVLIFYKKLHQPLWIVLVLAGVVLLAIMNWVLIRLSFYHKAFAVREHDIIYRTGWLIRSIRVCPFKRIQHCSVDAGLFERKFGLASLSVFTAGGNEADMKIPGLPEATASSLRELVIQKTGTDGNKL